ncbi:MAG: 2-isopropylmalate synthase [Eubacteriales bacterium]|nr:2-isopropylmalate synthase [Eubacteriales bacterium]
MDNASKYDIQYYQPPVVTYDWVKKDHIDKAPAWCSVDLRDGNQALVVPMDLDTKVEFFKYLVKLGFKEIEVGFPAASDTEFEFLRTLIDQDLVPDDVKLQVLTQSREHIIRKTFDALKGAKNPIVHLYNSTSVAQREQVFKKSKDEIKKIATDGAQMFLDIAKEYPDINFQYEYSPESFTGTEPEYALEVCNAVIDIWKPTPDHKVIINLPATVEMSLPHVYANQVEYVSKNLHDRENVILSLHPHNDRGTGVADAELGVLAGADRIEGTLFGNGERTGNVDIVTLAINMFTHGVDPNLEFTDMPDVVEHYEEYTGMTVEPRHPYSGALVFAAFSGSHQDAIAKGVKYRKERGTDQWTVPYLPIDPHDVGRQYDGDVIRINSQSGKGGVSYLIERDHGFNIPKEMRAEVGYMMKGISDHEHRELSSDEIFDTFSKEYVNYFDPIDIVEANFIHFSTTKDESADSVGVKMLVHIGDEAYSLEGDGNGRLDAVSNALKKTKYNFNYKFITYSEHAISAESNSKAAAYVCIADQLDNKFWGVGTHDDIILASVNALVSALNRMNKKVHFVK